MGRACQRTPHQSKTGLILSPVLRGEEWVPRSQEKNSSPRCLTEAPSSIHLSSCILRDVSTPSASARPPHHARAPGRAVQASPLARHHPQTPARSQAIARPLCPLAPSRSQPCASHRIASFPPPVRQPAPGPRGRSCLETSRARIGDVGKAAGADPVDRLARRRRGPRPAVSHPSSCAAACDWRGPGRATRWQREARRRRRRIMIRAVDGGMGVLRRLLFACCCFFFFSRLLGEEVGRGALPMGTGRAWRISIFFHDGCRAKGGELMGESDGEAGVWPA